MEVSGDYGKLKDYLEAVEQKKFVRLHIGSQDQRIKLKRGRFWFTPENHLQSQSETFVNTLQNLGLRIEQVNTLRNRIHTIQLEQENRRNISLLFKIVKYVIGFFTGRLTYERFVKVQLNNLLDTLDQINPASEISQEIKLEDRTLLQHERAYTNDGYMHITIRHHLLHANPLLVIDEIARTLANNQSISSLFVKFLMPNGTEMNGYDGGGLSRLFISKLIPSAIQTLCAKLDDCLPILETPQDANRWMALGRLIRYANLCNEEKINIGECFSLKVFEKLIDINLKYKNKNEKVRLEMLFGLLEFSDMPKQKIEMRELIIKGCESWTSTDLREKILPYIYNVMGEVPLLNAEDEESLYVIEKETIRWVKEPVMIDIEKNGKTKHVQKTEPKISQDGNTVFHPVFEDKAVRTTTVEYPISEEICNNSDYKNKVLLELCEIVFGVEKPEDVDCKKFAIDQCLLLLSGEKLAIVELAKGLFALNEKNPTIIPCPSAWELRENIEGKPENYKYIQSRLIGNMEAIGWVKRWIDKNKNKHNILRDFVQLSTGKRILGETKIDIRKMDLYTGSAVEYHSCSSQAVFNANLIRSFEDLEIALSGLDSQLKEGFNAR